MTPHIRVHTDPAPIRPTKPRGTGRVPLGQLLLDSGALAPGDLLQALAMRARQDARLGDILLTHGMVTEHALFAALSQQWSAQVVDLAAGPADPRLIDQVGPEWCIRHGAIPWRKLGGITIFATARPEQFMALTQDLPLSLRPALMGLAPDREIQNALLHSRQSALVRKAETRVRPEDSCRSWHVPVLRRWVLSVLIAVLALAIAAPMTLFSLLFGWAVLTLVLSSALKAAAAVIHLRQPPPIVGPDAPMIARLPTVSIMVPLFKETNIAGRLVKRLQKLNYPREILDICLVTEADDTQTRETLARTHLPPWIRTIAVPRGTLKTKPRALNYALDFCRGSIIGVYDAEDAPDPEQIHKVVRRFHQRGPDVACLQGVLDFYNVRTNWLSRCFAIEYASWFRIVLPGLQKMGFAIPLGGTTLFFRRDALERLGGWDAHNVTEDADLGIRLARYGYRAELIDTVTEEEANCRAWPWVKQRSRWLKGYGMTWGVHMRSPRRLLADLGWWKFIGVQLLFLATLSQFVLAPLLWSFWLIPLGLPHPFSGGETHGLLMALGLLFFCTECVNIAVGILAVRETKHRHLYPWIPLLYVYFHMGALASYKGIYELVTKPFYWDKTTHGLHDQPVTAPPTAPLTSLRQA
ncbi:glycosyltransferase [Pseudogemmobacter sp. W21_MBD1_M6]|uniref:glycosyltransferase n=1 Tax=Pseudogemmobacter sp. W21_MBD1_M6 TaxID=3240271 RepID=UPI003F9A4317